MEAVGRSLPASIPKVRPYEHAHAGRVGCRVFSDALPVPIFVPFWSGGMLREHYADNPLGRIAEDAVHCQAPAGLPLRRESRSVGVSPGGVLCTRQGCVATDAGTLATAARGLAVGSPAACGRLVLPFSCCSILVIKWGQCSGKKHGNLQPPPWSLVIRSVMDGREASIVSIWEGSIDSGLGSFWRCCVCLRSRKRNARR